MTRKHFQVIADAIARVEITGGDETTIAEIVNELSIEFAKQNERFDRARFEIAAMPRSARRKRDAILTALDRDAR